MVDEVLEVVEAAASGNQPTASQPHGAQVGCLVMPDEVEERSRKGPDQEGQHLLEGEHLSFIIHIITAPS